MKAGMGADEGGRVAVEERGGKKELDRWPHFYILEEAGRNRKGRAREQTKGREGGRERERAIDHDGTLVVAHIMTHYESL